MKHVKTFLHGCLIGLEILFGISLFALAVYLFKLAIAGNTWALVGLGIYFLLSCGSYAVASQL